MDGRKKLQAAVGCAVAAMGAALVLCTREDAVSAQAQAGATIPFSLGLILLCVGLVVALSTLSKAKPKTNVRTMTMAALFAALCYVGFMQFRIDIPVGDSSTAFHLGNVFCVLAALLLGGLWGGMAGAVGMTLADLMVPAYVVSAPKTFLLKLCIGLITGFLAHGVFRISQDRPRKLPLPAAVALSCSCGMLFNVVADPLVGYFYKRFLLGMPQDAAAIFAKMGAMTTAVNAAIAVAAATIFYLALRPALKRTRLLPQL